jgi:hypothetical protein
VVQCYSHYIFVHFYHFLWKIGTFLANQFYDFVAIFIKIINLYFKISLPIF